MDADTMRVALLSSSYHPHFGGVEEHVRHVARELQRRGHAVEVWTVDRGDGLRDEIVEGTRVRYLSTPLPARSTKAMGSFALHAPRALASWLSAYAAFRPDVINIQCFGPNGVYGFALARLTRTPLVVSSHGETFMDEHGVFDRSALLRGSLIRAVGSSAVTACSSLVAEDLRSRFGAGTVCVIPNGVHPRPQPASEARPASGTSDPVLIGVGRLVPQKGFDILLEAAARSRHEPTVWIVGDGAELSRLETLATALGIGERVEFLGRRSPEDVQELMAQATAVVVPSRVEAFGIVVLEAWASGTPVLATSRGGPAGFVTDGGDGLLIDPENLDSVVAAIDRVLDDRDWAESLALAGVLTVQSFTWGKVVDGYLQLFRSITSSCLA